MIPAVARAQPNIALVKYWGKRDEELILPAAGSLSLTLDGFPTTTAVTLAPAAAADIFVLNGIAQTGPAFKRVTRFLDLVRELAGATSRAAVLSRNMAPTGAGLASSAAGFAALAVAAAASYGLQLSKQQLSALARRGSGSAARSLISNVAVWHAGDDDASSFAEEVSAPAMHLVIVTISGAQKAISSREAMRQTALSSPFYPAWITSTERSLDEMLAACAAHDFQRIGGITETHALRMHAVIQSTDPPIRYLSPESIAVFDRVEQLRRSGVPAFATADAGPNVAVLCQPADAAKVAAALHDFGSVHTCGPGPGAALLTAEDAAAWIAAENAQLAKPVKDWPPQLGEAI